MTFDELCKDFNDHNVAYIRRSGAETGIELLVSITWENGNMSSNDLLRNWLNENGIEYINNDGTVWLGMTV